MSLIGNSAEERIERIRQLESDLAEARKLVETWRPIVAPYLQRDVARKAMIDQMHKTYPQYLSEVWHGQELMCLNVMVYGVPDICIDEVAHRIYEIGEAIDKDIMFLAMCKTPDVTATYYSERVTELSKTKGEGMK